MGEQAKDTAQGNRTDAEHRNLRLMCSDISVPAGARSEGGFVIANPDNPFQGLRGDGRVMPTTTDGC